MDTILSTVDTVSLGMVTSEEPPWAYIATFHDKNKQCLGFFFLIPLQNHSLYLKLDTHLGNLIYEFVAL